MMTMQCSSLSVPQREQDLALKQPCCPRSWLRPALLAWWLYEAIHSSLISVATKNSIKTDFTQTATFEVITSDEHVVLLDENLRSQERR